MAFAGRVHGDLEVTVGRPAAVSLSAHVLLPQGFRPAIQMVLHRTRQISHTVKGRVEGYDGKVLFWNLFQADLMDLGMGGACETKG